jgi:hypothetical protein
MSQTGGTKILIERKNLDREKKSWSREKSLVEQKSKIGFSCDLDNISLASVASYPS